MIVLHATRDGRIIGVLGAEYDIAIEDGALVIRHRRFEEPIRMSPGDEPDHFTGGFPIAIAEFVRDETGRVVAVRVGNMRTRDVRFEKVDDGT